MLKTNSASAAERQEKSIKSQHFHFIFAKKIFAKFDLHSFGFPGFCCCCCFHPGINICLKATQFCTSYDNTNSLSPATSYHLKGNNCKETEQGVKIYSWSISIFELCCPQTIRQQRYEEQLHTHLKMVKLVQRPQTFYVCKSQQPL